MLNIRIPKLFRQIGLSGGAAVIIQGSTLLLIVFLSNVLGPVGLAQFAVTQNTVTALSQVAQAGLAISASTYIAKYHLRNDVLARQIMNFCLGATLMLSFSVAAILAIGSAPIASEIYGDDDLVAMVLIAAAALPFAAIVLTQIGVLNGMGIYRPQFWTALVSSALLVGAAGVGAWLWGPVGAALGFGTATFIRAAILHWVIKVNLPSSRSTMADKLIAWQRIKHFAVPAGLAGLTLTPSTWIANAFLVNFRGLEELGIFLAALSVRSAVSFIPQQIGSIFLPYFLRLDGDIQENDSRYFARILALMTGTACVFSLPIAIFGSHILGLFGNEFTAARMMLNCLLLGVVIESASLAFSNRYAARERMWSVLLLYTFPKDILLVIAAYLLIPDWGGLGLAIAYLCSAIYGLLSYILIAKTQHWRVFKQGSIQDV